ncbi:MAG: bile acid:sodium symporter family protein [Candidatus Omnitrophica bacterium]|jgi:BASS family bile acid:Na+ symporter|nr:bile acid:sodium symporter family protein [Candidatus Omnitrophota bacterium]
MKSLASFLKFYTKYLAVWVFICGIIAYLYPKPFIALREGMDFFFALTMFGIGCVLNIQDFQRIAKQPQIVLIGSFLQFTLMPFGAFMVAKLLNLPPNIALGLILTGSAPGAMASNVISYVAKADVVYSVSLTTVSTILAPVMTPTLTYILAHSILRVDFWGMFFSMVKMVIGPLLLGLFLKYKFSRSIEKLEPLFPAISVTFIIFICSLVIALNKTFLVMLTFIVIAAVFLLNLWGMASGYFMGKILKMEIARRRTLSIEIGMQNAGLGTVLALKHFNEQVAVPAACFVFVCIFTASIMAEIWRKSSNYQQ